MSRHDNPTRLVLGMGGVIDGQHYTVVGRVVFSVKLDGELYFWNEFNLTDQKIGGELTLVYEDTESGSPWKLFKRLNLLEPITASEASSYQVGDKVRFDHLTAKVSLVGTSTVVHIEGRAPTGVVTGEISGYFNAVTGNQILVASWIGQKIEFFQGQTFTPHWMAKTFGLPSAREQGSAFENFGQRLGITFSSLLIAGVVLLGGFIAYADWAGNQPGTVRPRTTQAAPAFQLAAQTAGRLDGMNYTITSHTLVEVAGVGGKFRRHEYELKAAGGEVALLIHALDGDAKTWHLFIPIPVPPELTPLTAATQRPAGSGVRNVSNPTPSGQKTAPLDMVVVSGRVFAVSGLFLCQTFSPEGRSVPPELVRYGFVARNGSDLLLARWGETTLELHLGHALSDAEVRSTFAGGR